MPQIHIVDEGGRDKGAIGDTLPFPTKLVGTSLAAGPTFRTQRIQVPGIGTGTAYAAADAFGTQFTVEVPNDGVISTIVFFDLDDEGIQKDIVLFDKDFTATADNSAFAVNDDDILRCIGVASVNTYFNFANNQIGVATPALAYTAPEGRLWGQLVTRGTDDIAANNLPQLYMVITQ
jgi:hypothetical protein